MAKAMYLNFHNEIVKSTGSKEKIIPYPEVNVMSKAAEVKEPAYRK